MLLYPFVHTGLRLFVCFAAKKKAREIAGVKIFRFEAPLYFANVEHFRRSLVQETHLDVTELRHIQAAVQETDMSLRHEQVGLADCVMD